MLKVSFRTAIAAGLAIGLTWGAPRVASADVIAGPTLLYTTVGWQNGGMVFGAKVDARLTTLRVENAGSADVATLNDATDPANVVKVKDVAVPAGDTTYLATFDVNLVAGHTYRLQLTGPSSGENLRWVGFTTYPVDGAELRVDGAWNDGQAMMYPDWWFTFKDITTIPCDVDGDGHLAPACGGDDCDDRKPTVYPGATELCDGLDNDCSGVVDNGASADCVSAVPTRPHCLPPLDGGVDAGNVDAGDAGTVDGGADPKLLCVACVDDTHCIGAAKHCSATRACVECTTDAHCSSGSVCTNETCIATGTDGGSGVDGGSGGGSSGGGSSGSATPPDGGVDGAPPIEDVGCGCYVTGGGGGVGSAAGIGFGIAALFVARRRRARAARR